MINQQPISPYVKPPMKAWKIITVSVIGVAIIGGGTFFVTQKLSKSEETSAFPDKLSSCTKYKTTFIHPLTRETLEKKILGIIGGRCNYIEQMPNGGKMECKFTESVRIAAAQYYKDVAMAESVGTSVHIGSDGQKTKYTLDGKKVENPWQEAMDNGMCLISGY